MQLILDDNKVKQFSEKKRKKSYLDGTDKNTFLKSAIK